MAQAAPIVKSFSSAAADTSTKKTWMSPAFVASHQHAPHKLNAPYTIERFRDGLLIDEAAAAAVAH